MSSIKQRNWKEKGTTKILLVHSKSKILFFGTNKKTHLVYTLPTLQKQKLLLLISLLDFFCIALVHWFIASFLCCPPYSCRSLIDNYRYGDRWKTYNYNESNRQKKQRTEIKIRQKYTYNNFTGSNRENSNIAIAHLKNRQLERTKIISHFGCTNIIFASCINGSWWWTLTLVFEGVIQFRPCLLYALYYFLILNITLSVRNH